MSRIANPADTVDAFSANGDTIIGVRPAAPEFYEQLARQQSGLPPVNAREVKPAPVVPAEVPLPQINVANAYVGRRLQQLRQQAAGLEQGIQRGCVGAGGVQVEYLVTQQRQARAEVEQIQAEIIRIEGLDELAVKHLAFSLGAR